MIDDRRLTIREWAAELVPEHKRLTIEEATLFALISCNDRLTVIEGRIGDLAARYQLFDRFMADTAPGYRAPAHLDALKAGQS